MEHNAIHGDVRFGQWWMDVTFKNGFRYTNTRVAVRQWKTGRLCTSASSITSPHKEGSAATRHKTFTNLFR